VGQVRARLRRSHVYANQTFLVSLVPTGPA